ncbi:MAG: SIR2 family protein [Candidatus Electrothrix aestuarii]|uniref:SIR2 family protein n=1 Tax=Candidatus Electrothrix aestuarii TaxID=3062594 RepID=A0AAU8M242_9BACT|nr:SIR2 family protein [Candidatus Electrothrix aestuarii]
MPRIKKRGKGKAQVPGWRRNIIEQLREGKVLPIVGNAMHNDLLLQGHQQSVEAYRDFLAEEHGYPPACIKDLSLPGLARYHTIMLGSAEGRRLPGAELAVKREYLNFIKNRLFDLVEASDTEGMITGLLEEEEAQFDQHDFSLMAANLGRPAFAAPDADPLLILASFDIPIYITTSYHCFLEQALWAAGKKPRTGLCSWWSFDPNLVLPVPDLFADDYEPSVLEPLVYHLHGLDSCPESLVLSEDDYLAFLVNISQDQVNSSQENKMIHPRLRHALSDSSLMVLGYDLGDWDFRSLLYGLIKRRPAQPRNQSVCDLQLQPSPEDLAFLERSMSDVDFEVFQGDFAEYLRQVYVDLQR